MLKEAIKEAATIEEATRAAALELGVPVEKMQVEILQQPRKKPSVCSEAVPPGSGAMWRKAPLPLRRPISRRFSGAWATTRWKIEIKEEEKGCQLALSAEEFGSIIGRRGETLCPPVSHGLVANRVDNSYYRVTIDVGNYREKREEALQELARRIGNQAAQNRPPYLFGADESL